MMDGIGRLWHSCGSRGVDVHEPVCEADRILNLLGQRFRRSLFQSTVEVGHGEVRTNVPSLLEQSAGGEEGRGAQGKNKNLSSSQTSRSPSFSPFSFLCVMTSKPRKQKRDRCAKWLTPRQCRSPSPPSPASQGKAASGSSH